MTTLLAAQDALQDRILRATAKADARVAVRACCGPAEAHDRLRVYGDAYRLRLVEVLANDFPATAAALGEGAFARHAEGYVRETRSRHPSVRHFGEAFAHWLSTRPGAPPGLHELARFEWLQGETFDAADAAALGLDDVAALPPAGWAALPLRLHPAVRLMESQCLATDVHGPVPAAQEAPASWLLWRDAGGDVHWRRLDPDEAGALRLVAGGSPFGALCDALVAAHGDDGPLRAASLLKRWLVDGLLAAGAVPSD